MLQALMEKYHLIPHPEGGYYREIHRSENTVKSLAAKAERKALTHIYYLLPKGQISRFHRVLHDEIWNFYQGAPLRLMQYDTSRLKQEIIGGSDGPYVSIVPGGVYQAAETTGEYSLTGCTVAPGFEFEDFTFLRDDPAAEAGFRKKYPQYQRFI